MTSLEIRLRALGHELDLPPDPPDLATRVLAELQGRRPFPWRRAAVLALAVLAIAVAAAFAVPQARTAILRFFHLGGANVIRVDTLPPARERSLTHGFGKPLPQAGAERLLGFRMALPPVHGHPPARVYVIGNSIGTVALRRHGRPVLLSEFKSFGAQSLKKLMTAATTVEPVTVNGGAGLWIKGAPHTLTYFDRSFGFQERPVLIRGNVLLWVRGPLTLRLEGDLDRAAAIELARTVH
ncbi:MAG TPA: hypothetical protein VKB73_11365 [Gaiellaceae bacterium]|nr:hypothetical protein [Gaiellaceae bacterium]